MKDKKYWNILNQAVRLEVTHGHLLWTLTQLSKASKVSRPLIYHYFGKTKSNIVQEALKLISDEIFGLSPERITQWQQGQISESVMATRDLLDQAPFLREFYVHWRQTPSSIQDHLVDVEKRYKQKLKLLSKEITADSSAAMFSMLFGLVMAPEISEKSIRMVVDLIKGQLLTKE